MDHERDATKQKSCRNDKCPNRAASSQAVAEHGVLRNFFEDGDDVATKGP
jgi:hypothetical protein